MYQCSRLFAWSFNQAKYGSSFFFKPIAVVCDPVFFLNFQVLLVSIMQSRSGQINDISMNIHIKMTA